MEISIPGETLSDRIDRAHTLIARGIVERNRGDPRQNIEATRKLDIDLQNVTKSLPDKYWLAPSFTRLQPTTKEDTSKELMRLRDQLYQYNLLHLLHLPFLIHCGKESDYHMYAKITCINAARDVLTRFVAYQNFRPISAQSSHTADFFALMAGMTILIAHIDSCHWQNNNFLVHQRPGDRAMIEQLVEKLEHVAAQSKESLTGKSAEQLRSLLEIEGDAARGSRHTGESTVDRLREGCGEQFQLSIPYFGIIKICVKGITKEQPGQLAPDADMPVVPSSSNLMAADDNVFSTFDQNINDNAPSDLLAAQSNTQNFQTLQSGATSSDVIFDTPQHYPGLTAGTNDWAFQGVDAAFFDSLMKGVGDWEETLLGT
ncbi:hypothetical protein ACET3X_002680 [Alternaria dauci]|uniref:Uncharacterized protein n=1 Tax=Alternaria dauci TaxID=48095 RepID=A0ABR3URF0_9PLEO